MVRHEGNQKARVSIIFLLSFQLHEAPSRLHSPVDILGVFFMAKVNTRGTFFVPAGNYTYQHERNATWSLT